MVQRLGRRRKGEPRPICPRCGQPYSYIESHRVGGKEYFYAVHYYREEGGKRRRKRCYLGPKEYDYVTMTHEREGLMFKGLTESDRAITYLTALINSVSGPEFRLTPDLALKFADKLEMLAKRLRNYARIQEK